MGLALGGREEGSPRPVHIYFVFKKRNTDLPAIYHTLQPYCSVSTVLVSNNLWDIAFKAPPAQTFNMDGGGGDDGSGEEEEDRGWGRHGEGLQQSNPKKRVFSKQHHEQSDTFGFDLETAALRTGQKREFLCLVHRIVCASDHNLVSRFPATNIVQQMKLHSIHHLYAET